MKPQFGFGKNSHELLRIETPPLDYPNYVDLSPISDFSDVTLLSSSTSQSQMVFSNRPVNPFFSGKPHLADFNKAPVCFGSGIAKYEPETDFTKDSSPRFSGFGSSKCKRQAALDFPPPPFSPQFPNLPTRPSCFADSSLDKIPPLISIPVPPVVSASVPNPKDAPGPSGKLPRPRFKIQRNKKHKRPGFTPVVPKNSGPGIEMAVFDACPGSRMSEEQVQLLEAELVKALDSVQDVERQPKFLKSFFDQGVFWMICADESTKLWLIRNVRKLNQLWDGRHLKVVEAKIPKRPIVYVDLTDLEKSSEVLNRLNRQNPGLNTRRWVVLNRKVSKTGQRLTFSTDLDSFEFLKVKQFEVSWKLKTITFRVPGKVARGSNPPVQKNPPKSKGFSKFK